MPIPPIKEQAEGRIHPLLKMQRNALTLTLSQRERGFMEGRPYPRIEYGAGSNPLDSRFRGNDGEGGNEG